MNNPHEENPFRKGPETVFFWIVEGIAALLVIGLAVYFDLKSYTDAFAAWLLN